MMSESICIRNGSSAAAKLLSVQGFKMPFDSNFLLNVMNKSQELPLSKIPFYMLNNDFIINSLLKKILGNVINSTVNFTIMCLRNKSRDLAMAYICSACITSTVPMEKKVLERVLEYIKQTPRIVLSDPFIIKYLSEMIGDQNISVIEAIANHKKSDPRFLYIPVKLVGFWPDGHVNFLLIDHLTKKIYYFDPHIHNNCTGEIITELISLCYNLIKDYGYMFKSVFTLSIEPGDIQRNDPHCQTWVLLFCCLYVLNINNIDQCIVAASKYSSALIDVFMCYIGQFESEIQEWKEDPLGSNMKELNKQTYKIMEFIDSFEQVKNTSKQYEHLYKFISYYYDCFDIYDKVDFSEVRAEYRAVSIEQLIVKLSNLYLYILANNREDYVLREIRLNIEDTIKRNDESFTKEEIRRLYAVIRTIRRYM